MSYNAVVSMANSNSLRMRIVAAAAEQNVVNPQQWAQDNLWHVVASPGWAEKWRYALETLTINQNPDLGARDDVISDGDLLAVVQGMVNPAVTANQEG
jgi:hypothetical protein